MRSPGRKSKADTAWLNATVAFSTMATFLAAAPTSWPSSSYVSRTRGSASSSASYPPIAASRSRCAVIAWSTGWGMSAAPALLRWIRSRHPGVSRRQRSSSAGAEARDGEREGEVRAGMSGKLAGWALLLKSHRPRLKLQSGVSSLTRAEPRVYPRTSGLEQIAQDKPHIRRSLREPPHVPGEPMRPVADQDTHRYPLALERALRGGADAVQHVHLVGAPSRCDAERQGPLAQTRDEAEIVCTEHRTRLTLGGALEQPPGEHGVGGVHIALSRQRHVRRLVVGALYQSDGGREREQGLQVGRRAAQVGLQTYADPLMGGADGLEQLQGWVHIAGLLHIDPQKRPGGGRPRRQRQQVLEARLGIQVEAQVGELDGDFRGQLAPPDVLEHPQIVIPHEIGRASCRERV